MVQSTMAGGSLLALLDDIATVLDDVAILTKVAAKKTAGVLGDDLALNAEQVSGVRADRELPVVWAVAKGSGRNKLIPVPAGAGGGRAEGERPGGGAGAKDSLWDKLTRVPASRGCITRSFQFGPAGLMLG